MMGCPEIVEDIFKEDSFLLAEKNAGKIIDREYSDKTMWKEIIYRFTKNKGAVIGMAAILIIIVFAIIGPYMSGYSYDAVDMSRQNLVPRIPGIEKLGVFDGTIKGIDQYAMKGLDHTYYYFGTDNMGRDLWTRVFTGTRISLFVAGVAVIIDMVIGVVFGMISGYFGGIVDLVMQRIIEIISGIPNLVVVTLLMIVLKPGLLTIILALMFTNWIGMSRLVRAQVLRLKEQEYVIAAKSLGASDLYIVFREILPNTLSSVIIMAMMSIPGAIFMESFLSFIGLGIPEPMASLGTLISNGYKSMMIYPHMVAIPVTLFAILMISFNLVADGLRDALDPKMKAG
jgi:oligopeptide transport system permease protein